MQFNKWSPRFWVTRVTADAKIAGYWTSRMDPREEPSFLRNFDQWFEWCRAKHEGRIQIGGTTWKGGE